MRPSTSDVVAIPLTHLSHTDATWSEATRLILTRHEGAEREVHIYTPSRKASSVEHGMFDYVGTIDFRGLNHSRVSSILSKRQTTPTSLRTADLISPLLEDELATDIDLSNLAQALGIRIGSAVPIIHLSGSRIATSVSSGFLLIPSVVEHAERDAFLWSMCSSVAACLHSVAKRSDPLSPRPNELECIKWAVAGKTLREIAKITGFNYRTVRFYIDTARERYGYSSNIQLYVRAALDYSLEPLGSDQAIFCQDIPGAGPAIYRKHAASN
jgi:DNA-binding CsgD family transcriptional regulator